MRHRLVDQIGECRHVEPASVRVLVNKFLLPRLGQRKAQLVATDALRLYLKARGAFKIGSGDPELAGVFARGSEFSGRVVINNGGAKLFGRRMKSCKQKKKEQTGTHTGSHKLSPLVPGNYKAYDDMSIVAKDQRD